MLKLKNICKYYKIGKQKKIILDNITLDFDSKGLVFILGTSGSGKSTLLNIIGGNLKCDMGEVWLDNLCVSKLNEKKLNCYRYSIVSTIFQDYNLIDYMDVWDNIMLGYDNDLSSEEIINLLKKLNIYHKRFMTVSKLSGGEKQRVAIVRALVNNPKIILADEPTGALDCENSTSVMEILKDVAKDKLVIVVSHDNILASRYASKIINLKDGKCEYQEVKINNTEEFLLIKRKIKYLKIIHLAFKNLCLKKLRTIITAIAISLGIIGLFMVTNLYSNFNKEIMELEKRVVSVFPIVVKNGEFEILDYQEVQANNKIILKDKEKYIHTNRINEKYLNYLTSIKEIEYLTFDYNISMPIISDCYNLIDNKYFISIPSSKYIGENFEILYGNNINNSLDILLKIDSNNNVDSTILNYFGFDSDIDYQDIVGRKIKIAVNNDYYIKNNDYYIANRNYEELYSKSSIELTIAGIVREKEITNDNAFFYYDSSLIDLLIDINSRSDIVISQIESDYNVLGLDINKNDMLSYLGYNTIAVGVNIYTSNLSNKEIVLKQLDHYNQSNQKLIYVDTMSEAIDLLRGLISMISVILVAFSLISIIISSLMIGILTNVRVLERKKEIGILRNLGFSRRDVCHLFNVENIIIGIVAVVIGIVIINLMVDPLNKMMDKLITGTNIFSINYGIIFLVVIINLLIIRLSGIIPAKRAGKMDIVSCIYNR